MTATSLATHRLFVWIEVALAAVTFVSLFFITAPYGRHSRAGWGPTLPARVGWIVMETPPVAAFLAIFALGAHRADTVPIALCALWQFHYVQRAYLYPFRMRADGRRMPVAIVSLAITFNLLNAYVNARWISHLATYPSTWITDPRFVAGVALFLCGWGVNVWSDRVLATLRKPGESGYKIPRGGLYEWVSSPNYLGEILEWTGWAVATWSLAGLSFALYTFANLAPRAVSHHRWYRREFAEYPARRKALVPGVW